MQADANATTEAGVDKINQEWNPEDDDFISETVFAGIVLFAVGVAVLLAFFIYYAVRCVCWTCLGDVRTPLPCCSAVGPAEFPGVFRRHGSCAPVVHFCLCHSQVPLP